MRIRRSSGSLAGGVRTWAFCGRSTADRPAPHTRLAARSPVGDCRIASERRRVEAVVAGEVDQRLVVDEVAFGVLAADRGLHRS